MKSLKGTFRELIDDRSRLDERVMNVDNKYTQ